MADQPLLPNKSENQCQAQRDTEHYTSTYARHGHDRSYRTSTTYTCMSRHVLHPDLRTPRLCACEHDRGSSSTSLTIISTGWLGLGPGETSSLTWMRQQASNAQLNSAWHGTTARLDILFFTIVGPVAVYRRIYTAILPHTHTHTHTNAYCRADEHLQLSCTQGSTDWLLKAH